MRRLPLLLIPIVLSCSTVKPVEVDPNLAPPDDAVTKSVPDVKVAVVVDPPKKAPPKKKKSKQPDDASAMPAATPPRDLRVDYTANYAELYPSRVHMASAIPAALKEAGFDVVTVKDASEAQAKGAALILELADPEVEGFRRAQGGGISLEGNIYDVHVHYRARLMDGSGRVLTDVTGHGESSTHFFFNDKYLELAVVGAASIVLMAIVAAAAAIPGIIYFAYRLSTPGLDRVPLDGLCDAEQLQQSGGTITPGQCGGAAWLGAGVGYLAFVVVAAGVGLVFTQTVGGWIMKGTTGAIKSFISEGSWQDMVKLAHDRAARGFASEVAGISSRTSGLVPTARTP